MQLQLTIRRIKRAHIAQAVVAMVLMLVLLSAAVPFETLSSSHQCRMACCVAKSSQASSDHCSIKDHSSAQTSSSQDSLPTESIASPALMKPCSPECCAGVLSSAQGRRQRNQATLAGVVKPHPPTLVVFSRQSINPVRFFSHLSDPSLPRGPPLFI